MNRQPSRREFHALAGAGCLAAGSRLTAARPGGREPFRLNYLLATCMYGYQPLAGILPETTACGAAAIDIWPRVHGNQREQLDEMGAEVFAELLQQHQTRLGCITRFDLGPWGLQEEMKLARSLGCQTLVTGARGPAGRKGDELKSAVRQFAEQLKPQCAAAGQAGVVLAIENHTSTLLDSPDALRWFAELAPGQAAIALAPYHLPQDPGQLADLIRDTGNRLEVFYAWQYGMGCRDPLPPDQQRLQLPGRGDLDFGPLIAALRETGFAGWTEIFMHPVPRGDSIAGSIAAVTDEIRQARQYLESV